MKRSLLILFIGILVGILACATFPPEKDFTTELWFINFQEGRIERDDEHIYFEDMDTRKWVVVDVEDITAEWNYESLLIKSCEVWR